ncbi:MAG: DUF2726 domain-containing protein [Acidocella sp.]|nr:DUF2726 domain-containing protein [Acidocella sp.]
MDEGTKHVVRWIGFITFLIAVFAIRAMWRRHRDRRYQAAVSANNQRLQAIPQTSHNDLQMQAVNAGTFQPQRLMNGGEYNVFHIAEAMLEETPYRVCPQVSLGEVLSSPDKEAYRAINSKRIDLLIIDAQGFPIVAIEIQGRGHYQGNAAQRDAIKRTALLKAGITYAELTGEETMPEIVEMLTAILDFSIRPQKVNHI